MKKEDFKCTHPKCDYLGKSLYGLRAHLSHHTRKKREREDIASNGAHLTEIRFCPHCGKRIPNAIVEG